MARTAGRDPSCHRLPDPPVTRSIEEEAPAARSAGESTTPTEDLLSEIHVLANLIGRAFSGQLDRAFGMSVAEWRVLLTLERYPGLTAAELDTP